MLCYAPTSLSVAEIAGQLYLSVNTVRAHMRHPYASSTCTAATRPSNGPAPWACWCPPGAALPYLT